MVFPRHAAGHTFTSLTRSSLATELSCKVPHTRRQHARSHHRKYNQNKLLGSRSPTCPPIFQPMHLAARQRLCSGPSMCSSPLVRTDQRVGLISEVVSSVERTSECSKHGSGSRSRLNKMCDKAETQLPRTRKYVWKSHHQRIRLPAGKDSESTKERVGDAELPPETTNPTLGYASFRSGVLLVRDPHISGTIEA